MDTKIEPLHLHKIFSEFREFNTAVGDNYERLRPWFWWANIGRARRFWFLFVATVIEKISYLAHDLPCNKKFIIRAGGKFAGVIGIDRMSVDAPRPELWIFVTREATGQGVASSAIKQVEQYVAEKSVHEICARTDRQNIVAKKMLLRNDYRPCEYCTPDLTDMWVKKLNNKNY